MCTSRAQSSQCPLPEPPAGSFPGHLCRPALSLPNLSWRRPRELPENILSGVMFNLDFPTPTPAGAPAGKRDTHNPPAPPLFSSPSWILANSTLDSSSPPKSAGDVANPASPVHRSRWVRRPEVDLRPILQSSHRRERAGNTRHPQGLRAMPFGSGRGWFLFLRYPLYSVCVCVKFPHPKHSFKR